MVCGNTRTTRHVQPVQSFNQHLSSSYNFVLATTLCILLDYINSTALYLRLPEDDFSAPKHVGIFKTLVQFVNILGALVGEYV